MEAGRRIADLARELDVPDVVAVANKIRTEEDRRVIEDFCAEHDLPVAARVPFDDALIQAERAGRAPVDYEPESPAVAALGSLAEEILTG